jgi:hypothetical protein
MSRYSSCASVESSTFAVVLLVRPMHYDLGRAASCAGGGVSAATKRAVPLQETPVTAKRHAVTARAAVQRIR